MTRYLLFLLVAIVLCGADAEAQVKIEHRTTMTIKALDRTLVTENWTAVKGDRMMESNPASATLIDLKARKVFTLNHTNRTYTVETFDSIRESNDDIDPADAGAPTPQEVEASQALQEQMRALFDGYRVNKAPTGQHKTINGWDAREVVTTLRMPLPGGGAMTTTTTEWVADVPGVGEIDSFKKRFAAETGELSQDDLAARAAQSLSAALPNANITVDNTVSGTTILSVSNSGPADGTPEMTGPESVGIDMLKQMAEQAAFGVLGMKPAGAMAAAIFDVIRGRMRSTDNAADGTIRPIAVPSSTIQTEVVRASSTVSDQDLSIPSGYKEVRDADADDRGIRRR